MASALFSFCVHLLPSLWHEALPSDAVLVLGHRSPPFTGGERNERKERFVRNELASLMLAFPLGWLCTVTDSITSRRGAGGGMDTSEAGVCQAAFYYLKIMLLAPYRGQCCCEALARRRLLTASCALVFFPHSRILRERWVCTETVCYRAPGLISGGNSCSSDSAAASESFESNRAALTLQRCSLPGRACCFQRHPGEEGLRRKTVSQRLRGCSDLLCRTPRRGPPASVFSQFALPFPVPVTAEHWALHPA